MREALVAMLRADAGVSGQVGARVHWSRQPKEQNAFPYVNLSVASGFATMSLDGVDSVRDMRVQVDAWGQTYSDAVLTARAIKTALEGYRGTVSGVVFHGIFPDGERDLDGDMGATRIFGVSTDFLVSWSDG